MAADPITIVDAIASDLEANAGLTQQPKQLVKYFEPEFERPDQLPVMAVWIPTTDYVLDNTAGGYQRQHRLTVAWYEFNANEAEYGGTGDATVVTKLEAVLEKLTRRLATYAGGVPTLGNDVVVTLTRESREPTEGIAYAGVIELTVESLTSW